MAQDDLLFLTAAQAGALIRRKALSPVEYAEAVLAAAEAAQPRLNNFVLIARERALEAARDAERAVMAGAPLGPLHGIPVSVKDMVDVAGLPTTYGSAIFAEKVATGDDVLVARLRAAGAVLIGKTTMSEFGHKGLTDAPAFGVTPNPWNLSRTSGGSSGGAGSAVAAGLGPIALGMDGAGSIRIPAACCGVVGLKPTLGLVPWETASEAFGNYTYAGPMARSVTDAAVMLDAIAGPSPNDPWSMGREPGRGPSAALVGGDLSGLRIGYIERAGNPRVERAMAENARASLEVFAGMGATVEEAPAIDWAEFAGRIVYQAGFAVGMAKHLPEWRDRMDPVLLAFMERGAAFTLTQYREAQLARTALFRAVQGLMERFDVLVSPTLTRTALPADFDAAHDEVEVEGERCGITRQGWSAYVYPFNLTGHPALTVPSGFAGDGLPTGVQIIGRWGADKDVLRLGAMLEAARPWRDRLPPG